MICPASMHEDAYNIIEENKNLKAENKCLRDRNVELINDNEKLIAERAQIDVSYRELIELRKENENLKRYMATPSYEMAIEIQRLKDLVNRAKPWVEAWDIQGEPRIDILQWLTDYSKEIGG